MSGYIGTQPVPQATQTRDSFTATSGQTSFATGGYTPNFLDVYLNGVKLASADYTATNGSDVVLASGAATGDILEVVAFTTFNSASSSIDDNGNATAITIDSSENVLIGKTAQSVDTVGAEILPSGIGQFTVDDNFAGRFTRKTSDGDILVFRKGTGIVGTIGVAQSGDRTYFSGGSYGIASDTSDTTIMPCSANGTGNDGVVSLGKSDARFKDAYLSGGVYLGGTGSANKLDDYEEGTFTPVVGSAGGGSTSGGVFSGRYTKVGNLVTINFHCVNFAFSGGSGDLQITGFPFTPVELSTRPTRGGNVVFYRYDLPDTGYGNIVPEMNDTGVMKFRVPVDNSNWVAVTCENGSTLYVEGMMTYFTNA